MADVRKKAKLEHEARLENESKLEPGPVRDPEAPFAESLLRTLSVTDAAADVTILVLTTASLLPVIQGMNALTKSATDTYAAMISTNQASETTAMATLGRTVDVILGRPRVDVTAGDVALKKKKTKDEVVIEETIYPAAFYGAPVVT
jgi:hypothetical protein